MGTLWCTRGTHRERREVREEELKGMELLSWFLARALGDTAQDRRGEGLQAGQRRCTSTAGGHR